MAFCVCHPRSTRATAHAKCTTWPHASIAHGLALSGSGGVPSHAGHGSKCAGRGGRCAPRGFLRGGPREAGRGISAASNARESAEASSSAFAFALAFAFAPVPSFPFFSFLASVFPGVPREASPVASPDPDPVPPPAGARFSSPGAGASRFVGSPAEILLPRRVSSTNFTPLDTSAAASSSNSSAHPHRRHGKHVVSPLTPPHAWPHACVLVHASASVRTHAGASHTDALSANTERSSAVERHQATSAPPGLSRRPGDESFATVRKPSAGLSSARGATPSPFAPPPPFPAALRRSRADAPRPAATASPLSLPALAGKKCLPGSSVVAAQYRHRGDARFAAARAHEGVPAWYGDAKQSAQKSTEQTPHANILRWRCSSAGRESQRPVCGSR